MGALLSYSLTGGLYMLALYLAYRVCIAKENQHVFNRGVLLLIYIVSFSIPIFTTRIIGLRNGISTTSASQNIEILSDNITGQSQSIWWTIILIIYCVGMVACFGKSLYTWIKLTQIIRKGNKIKRDTYTLVIIDKDEYAPFSWLNYIVISRNDKNNVAILSHELKHVVSHHWIDLIIAQAVCIINWFNPGAWLMRDELMLVHEYQADMAVIENGNDPREYQMLLIKKAVGSRFPSLANSLNHSKLKKRITMMYKSKSGAGRKLRALALVPMLVLAIGVTGVPAVRAAVSNLSSRTLTMDKGSEKSSKSSNDAKSFKVTNINREGNFTTVTIEGEDIGNNISVTGGTLISNGKKYNESSMQTTLNNGFAVIKVGFDFAEELKNASMTLSVNGETVPFNLSSFANGKTSSLQVNGKLTTVGDMKIYIDGEEITETQMNDINPANIESITVDKKGKKLLITLKK